MSRTLHARLTRIEKQMRTGTLSELICRCGAFVQANLRNQSAESVIAALYGALSSEDAERLQHFLNDIESGVNVQMPHIRFNQ